MTLSWAHVHLLLNHFPIVGAIAALLILIVGMVRRNRGLNLVSYWMFFIVALITILVYFSGNQAAEAVEALPNVTEAIVHRHREVAEWAFIGLEIMAALSLMGMFLMWQSKRSPRWFNVVFLLGAIASTLLVSWAGMHGGTIRHTEVRGELAPILLDLDAFTHEENESGHEHSSTVLREE